MKILVIDGCGRKGNTWKLTKKAMEVIAAVYPDTEFEELVLAKEPLPLCIGCSNCFRVGHEKCSHYGIVSPIIEKIERADGVILCSGVYNWSETGYVKNLFDHLCFMLHRPYFYRQKALVITTAGGTGQKKAAKRISDTLTGIGFNRCCRLALASFSWNAYEPGDRAKKRVTAQALRFAGDVASGKLHNPKLINLMPYNIMRGMGQHCTQTSEYPTMDGVWWTMPERKSCAYFQQVRLTPFRRVFGELFYRFGRLMGGMKRMQVTYRK